MSPPNERSPGPLNAAGWAALVFTVGGATALAWGALGSSGWVPAIEAALGPVCHHAPARTLTVGGEPMAVCARCSGLYAGAALGAWTGWLTPRPWLRVGAGLAGAATALGLAAAALEAAGALATTNEVRAGLGVALGFGVPWVAARGGALLARAR